MEDSAEFRARLIAVCQAPLAEARELLVGAPELLSDLSEDHLSDLIETCREADDWRSAATLRRALSLIRRARALGVDAAVAEAQAVENGQLPADLGDLPYRAAEVGARYEASGRLADLDELVAQWDAVLDHPLIDRAHPGLRWGALIDGGAAYFTRSSHAGHSGDLDAAIERWQQVDLEMSPGASAAATIHDNLAVAFLARYWATGAADDLASAVAWAEAAVGEAQPTDELLPKYESDLAGVLQERHLRTGSLDDLDRAIVLYEGALDHMPAGTAVHASTLNNLATALNDRFERTADPADRVLAAQLLHRSVDSTAAGPVESSRHRANLAGVAATVAAAVELRRDALATPTDNPAVRAANLHNLAASLIDLFIETFDRSALDEAIDLIEEALDLVDVDSPDLPHYSLSCGNARRLRFIAELDPDERLEQLMRGLDVLDVAITSGLERRPDVALQAARHAGDWYGEIENWEQAAAVYGQGLRAGERLLRVQLERESKETWLTSIGDLPSRAAYSYAEVDDPRAAVVAIERGHAILLAEVLELKHADLHRLHVEGRADLSGRFRDLVERWADLTSPRLE